jgi:hypothetical protein
MPLIPLISEILNTTPKPGEGCLRKLRVRAVGLSRFVLGFGMVLGIIGDKYESGQKNAKNYYKGNHNNEIDIGIHWQSILLYA